ncbi:MAG: hypothetical protein LZF86_190564 [Nitrospira sp.]|nr:MAG: hypothetical protein LZF86_190564 [Nitrospira sp.]
MMGSSVWGGGTVAVPTVKSRVINWAEIGKLLA